MAKGLIQSKGQLRVAGLATGSELIRFTLRDDEVANVRAVQWVQAIAPQLATSSSAVAAELNHNHRPPTLIDFFAFPGSWAPFILSQDVLVEGGTFLIPCFQWLYPDPGFDIGGDQLMFVSNLLADPVSIQCNVLWAPKKVSLGEKAAVVSRTVQVLDPENF